MHFINRIGFLICLGAVATLSFIATTTWLDKSSAILIANKTAPPATSSVAQPSPESSVTGHRVADIKIVTGSTGSYCELTFPLDHCPTNPPGYAVTQNKTLRDIWEGADKSEERCMRRAAEYHSYCKFDGTVTARFYSNGRAIASNSVP